MNDIVPPILKYLKKYFNLDLIFYNEDIINIDGIKIPNFYKN